MTPVKKATPIGDRHQERPTESKEEKHVREHRAKAICAICPVRIECLEYAVRTHESHGIWGGLNELERRLLIRERERRAAGDRLWGVR